MTTGNFIQAVNEIKNNGGSRQTMYIREAWTDREMTIFTYADGTAEVFEGTHQFMSFSSEFEAVTVINKMQADYNKAVAESNARAEANRKSVKIDYCPISEYYGRAGVYYGD